MMTAEEKDKVERGRWGGGRHLYQGSPLEGGALEQRPEEVRAFTGFTRSFKRYMLSTYCTPALS